MLLCKLRLYVLSTFFFSRNQIISLLIFSVDFRLIWSYFVFALVKCSRVTRLSLRIMLTSVTNVNDRSMRKWLVWRWNYVLQQKLGEYHISFNDGTSDYAKAEDIGGGELFLLENTVSLLMFQDFCLKKLSCCHQYIFLIVFLCSSLVIFGNIKNTYVPKMYFTEHQPHSDWRNSNQSFTSMSALCKKESLCTKIVVARLQSSGLRLKHCFN